MTTAAIPPLELTNPISPGYYWLRHWDGSFLVGKYEYHQWWVCGLPNPVEIGKDQIIHYIPVPMN